MKLLVTGSAGHLGEALVRTLLDLQHDVVGLDIVQSPFTTFVGSIADLSWVRCGQGSPDGDQEAFESTSTRSGKRKVATQL